VTVDTRLPLFVLPLAAVPGEELPLHVFEPRYRELAQHCLTGDDEFGVLMTDEAGARDVGCAARIDRVARRYDDGRLDLITRATRRFELAGEIEDDPYPVAAVRWIEDQPAAAGDADPKPSLALFGELATRVTGTVPGLDVDDETSFRIAARVAFGGAAKQGLIELRSEAQRLDLLERLLRAALARLAQVELRQARARSNGKVHFE